MEIRIAEHPILGVQEKGKKVNFTYNGQVVEGYEGEPIAAALKAAGLMVHRYTAKEHKARGIFCAIGRCTDCEQTKYVLDKQIKLLEEAGCKKEEVVRVKVYATDMKMGGDICKAYSEFFHDIKPLCTVVGTTALNRPTQFVEIEMDAVSGSYVE